jgi:hypothetical protein
MMIEERRIEGEKRGSSMINRRGGEGRWER